MSEENCAEQELNGLEEGEYAMTDEEETNLVQEKGKNMKQHICRSAIGVHAA